MMSRSEIHSRFCELFAFDRPLPIPAEQLREVESELGTTFPQSYFDFATRFGVIYTPEILTLMTGGESEIPPEGARMDIKNFLSPAEIVETTRSYWSGGMDEWLIAIANDCMGNVFGFRKTEGGVRPEEATVFVFDHDFCETSEEESGFDAWLESFIKIREH